MSVANLVSIDSLRKQSNALEKEKSLEEFWTAQVPGKLAYKDIFEATPDTTSRSAIRFFQGWIKTSENIVNDMLLLVNLEALANAFVQYIAEKKAETATLFIEDEECLVELKTFLAVKALEMKRQEESRGRLAFFSNFARTEMGKREFLKENRGYLHESLNALVKGVRENPDRLGDLRDDDVSKIYGFFERITDSKLNTLLARLPSGDIIQSLSESSTDKNDAA